MDKKNYWIYILHCENNSYYTGYTINLIKRYQSHLKGKASKYTRSFKPTSIAQRWQLLCDKSTAMKIESNIKSLSRIQKEKLIASPSLILEFLNKHSGISEFLVLDFDSKLHSEKNHR